MRSEYCRPPGSFVVFYFVCGANTGDPSKTRPPVYTPFSPPLLKWNPVVACVLFSSFRPLKPKSHRSEINRDVSFSTFGSFAYGSCKLLEHRKVQTSIWSALPDHPLLSYIRSATPFIIPLRCVPTPSASYVRTTIFFSFSWLIFFLYHGLPLTQVGNMRWWPNFCFRKRLRIFSRFFYFLTNGSLYIKRKSRLSLSPFVPFSLAYSLPTIFPTVGVLHNVIS